MKQQQKVHSEINKNRTSSKPAAIVLLKHKSTHDNTATKK